MKERRDPYYFSMRTLEALFVVFVRTRPWKEPVRRIEEDKVTDVCSPLLLLWWMLSPIVLGFGECGLDRETAV